MDAAVAIERTPDLLDVAAAKARLALQLSDYRVDFAAEARSAAAAGVSNPALLVREMLRAMYGPGRLSAHEYMYYRLYDRSSAGDDPRRYLGRKRLADVYTSCNDRCWFAALEDKVLCHMAVAATGLPIPKTRAIYTKRTRHLDAPAIREQSALESFLRDPSHYPLFAKTIGGLGSIGVLSLAHTDGERIDFTTGETAPVDAVARFIHEFDGDGFLLQERLDPHPDLREAFGPILATIRFLVLLSPDAARVESAVIKIPTAHNPGDNAWRTGNMLGALNDNGTITRVVTGTGAALRELTHHPETGAPLVGLTLPFWEDASTLCLSAATVFPPVRIQSWDVALTGAGPVLIEGNWGGAINLHQLAHHRGALTPTFVDHLRQCGCTLIR